MKYLASLKIILLVAATLILCTLLAAFLLNAPAFVTNQPDSLALPTSPSPSTVSSQTTATSAGSVQGVNTTIAQSEVFDLFKLYLLINAHRKEHKLSPLLIHPSLEQSAQDKIADMVAKKYYRHQDTSDTPSWYLFKKAGYMYLKAGENLSFVHQSPWQVFDAWQQSPQHNQQLLTPEYVDMGLAADCETFKNYPDGGCIVVLHLGTD